MPTSVETILKQSSNLLEITAPPDPVPNQNVESNWYKSDIYSSMVGYAVVEPTADAEIVIQQTIDRGGEVDRENRITPSTSGNATLIEVPIVGDFARARLDVTGDPTKVRVILYLNRRSSSVYDIQ